MNSWNCKMPYSLNCSHFQAPPSFCHIYQPIEKAMIGMPPLEARGNRPLQMTFEDQLKALIFFHLEEHSSAQCLLQVLEEDVFARRVIAPQQGIKKSSFAEAINSRGLEQLSYIYQNLQTRAEIFCLVEASSQGLPSDRQERVRPNGTTTCWTHHILAPRHLLP
jgi:hypothetical protein